MSVHSEHRLGIWLNTSVRFLEETAEQDLRGARNDATWYAASNEGTAQAHNNVVFLVRRAKATSAATANELETTRSRLYGHCSTPAFTMETHKIPNKFIRWLVKRDTRRLTARVLARLREVEDRVPPYSPH